MPNEKSNSGLDERQILSMDTSKQTSVNCLNKGLKFQSYWTQAVE